MTIDSINNYPNGAMELGETHETLRELPCLSSLNEEELSIISAKSNIRTFTKNELLFRESSDVKFIFIVISGQIKLFKTSENGRELIIKLMGPREYFCCAPLYLDKQYAVSATAMEDSELVVIPVADFKNIITSGVSSVGIRMISGLCRRIKYLSNMVTDLSFKDVEQRIIMILLRFAKEKSPDDKSVYLTLSHQDIASMTGTVREVVSRIMSKMKKNGIITETNVKGFVVNKEKLEDLLD